MKWLSNMFPERALKREIARKKLQVLQNIDMRQTSRYRDSSSNRMSSDKTWETDYRGRWVNHMLDESKDLRGRARVLTDNSFLAKCILKASVNFTIGHGTSIQPTTLDDDFNLRASTAWERYWKNPEIRGMRTGGEIERLLYRQFKRDGDVGIHLLKNGKIQVIEGDEIQTPDSHSSDSAVVEGIRVNRFGRPTTFYHVRDIDSGLRTEFSQIDARNMLWVAFTDSIKQVRGRTAFVGSFELFDQFEGYIEATIIAARIAASFALVLKGGGSVWDEMTDTTDANGNSVKEWNMEPGEILRLGPHDEIKPLQPAHPNTQFEQMVKSLVKFCALQLDLPIEIALMDFSEVNYSSARAAMVIAERAAEASHSEFAEKTISRIYQWFISREIKSGRLKGPKVAARDTTFDHLAIRHPMEYLDPAKEIDGILAAIDGGLLTHDEALRGRSSTFIKWLEQRQREQEQIEEAGVTVGRSTRTRDETQALPLIEEDEEQEEETEDDDE